VLTLPRDSVTISLQSLERVTRLDGAGDAVRIQRRDYEGWLDMLVRLSQFQDKNNFDVHSALYTATAFASP
jgi:hypothetical protein